MASVGEFEYVPCGDCAGGGAPPVVINVTPATGINIATDQSIQFDVIDSSEGIRRIIIYVAYAHNGIVEAIHTGDGFCPDFAFLSTKVSITNGYRYHIIRTGGWLDNSITVTVDAISDSGQED